MPVTVIEAGPCPVVAGARATAADGYDAVQLAFERGATPKRLNKPETGHLAKAGVGPAPPPRRVPRHDRADRRRDRHGRGLRAGRPHQGHRHVERQGLRRHHQAAQLRPRPGVATARTTCASPGSIGQSAQPARVFKGMRMTGHMGDERVTQRGLVVVDRDSDAQRAARLRLRAGLQGRRSSRSGRTRADGRSRLPSSAARRPPSCDETVFGLEVERAAAARGREGRGGRAAARARTPRRPAARWPAVAPSRGARRAPAAPARARPAPRHWRGGGVDLRAAPALVHREGEPQGVPAGARHRALAARRPAARSASFDARAFDAPRTKDAIALLAERREDRPLVVVVTEERGRRAACSFRNLRARRRADRRRARGRRGLLWARSLLVSTDALERAHWRSARTAGADDARRGGGRREVARRATRARVILAPVVSEKSYALIEDNRYTFRVHPDAHKTQIRQAIEELFGVRVMDVKMIKARPKPQAPRHPPRHAPGLQEGDRPRAPRARRSRSSRG